MPLLFGSCKQATCKPAIVHQFWCHTPHAPNSACWLHFFY